ncbi:MAG: glycosyltransferase family 39 protein [Ignavibacteriales bacterium]|nr:glycosyltransferase family 39 protein [Ignavibacteriales bacterium]
MSPSEKTSFIEKIKQAPSHTVLLFFSTSLFLVQVLPRLLSYGVFFDGLTYSSLTRNLAEGKGSFLSLYYTDTLYPRFIEHPPLAMFLQSLAFRLFGDAFFIETIYSALLGLITLLLIIRIWKLLQRKDIGLSGAYAPVLMFALYPIVSWVYANNMLENTLTIFILLAVYFFIRGMLHTMPLKQVVNIIAGTVFLFCAVLVKGPVALFPLVLPLAWYIIYFDIPLPSAVVYTIVILAALGLLTAFLIFPFREGVQFFKDYFNNQVMRSLSGDREAADSKFVIFKRFFFESLVSLGVAGILFFIFRGPIKILRNKTFHFVLIIALCGSLPFGLIPKQMGWYLIPSLPFYAMALDALFSSSFTALEDKLTEKPVIKSVFLYLAIALTAASLVLMATEYQKVRKEKDFFNNLVIDRFPFSERTIISTYPPELSEKRIPCFCSSTGGCIPKVKQNLLCSKKDKLRL